MGRPGCDNAWGDTDTAPEYPTEMSQLGRAGAALWRATLERFTLNAAGGDPPSSDRLAGTRSIRTRSS